MQNDTTQAHTLPMTGTINSRIGPLAFEGGYPTDATVAKLYDEMDFQRATQAYMWAIPIVSFAKLQEQYEKVFGQEDGDLVLMTSSRDKLGMLTPNDTTPYLVGFLNLERTGPLVLEYPKGPTAGGILDFWQRPITDLGLSGPDRGEGGKYLVVPPGQKAPKGAEGYRVFESPTNNILHGFRVLATDPKEAEALKGSYQVYSYAERDNPRKTRIIPAEEKKWSGWPGTGLEYWQLESKMLNEEPVHERDRMMVAMLKPLGIEKGKKFEPDARQKKILEQAAVVGEAMARAQSYAKRRRRPSCGPATQWKNAILLEADQETKYHTALDERTAWFYEAVTLSAGMTTQDSRSGAGLHRHPEGQGRAMAAGRQRLYAPRSAKCPREAVLGLDAVRHGDPQLHRNEARHRRPGFQEGPGQERRRFRGLVHRPGGPEGQGEELDSDGPRSWLVRLLPPLRTDRSLLRSELETARSRSRQVTFE